MVNHKMKSSFTKLFITSLICLAGLTSSVTAQSSNDPAMVPQTDQSLSRAYSLDELLSTETQLKLAELRCPMSQQRLKRFTIGEWRGLPFEKQMEVVCALILISRGPEMMEQIVPSSSNISPEDYSVVTRALLVIAEGHRPPDNLNIVEPLSASLVALGLMVGEDGRNLRMAVYE